MDREDLIRETIKESISVKQKISDQLIESIITISDMIAKTLRQNGTVYLFGNGGSAADAQHVAAEFIGRFESERRPLPAEALTTNTSILTAVSNDYDFTEIFTRQVRAKVRPIDVVIGISTSGTSKNVLNGLKEARSIGALTIGFAGSNIAEMSEVSDICLAVPSGRTPRIQEGHIMLWHIICDLVEKSLFEDSKK
jgi:D-sedoheptulose 7-phosphate isomerase